MPWFKVDDKLHDHRKARIAGPTAMGVWVLGGSWAADRLTDGFIPAAVLNRFGRKRDADRLVEAGLWFADTQDGEEGWRFHGWEEYQPSRAEILEVRAVRAEAGRKGGIASGKSRGEAKTKQSASPTVRGGLKQKRTPVPEPVPEPSATDVADTPDDLFDAFWQTYPRKISKGHARKAWASAVKKVQPGRIVEAALEYAEWCEREHTETRYIKHPSSWLNGECWDDERPARSEPLTRVGEHLALVQKYAEEEQRQIGPA